MAGQDREAANFPRIGVIRGRIERLGNPHTVGFPIMLRAPTSASPKSDRRSANRDRCVLRCRVTHGPLQEVAEGVIRDLHDGGARLRLLSRATVAGRVRLEVYPAKGAYLADVIWQRGDTIGVRLVATLDQIVEQQIEALRRLEAQMRHAGNRSALGDGY